MKYYLTTLTCFKFFGKCQQSHLVDIYVTVITSEKKNKIVFLTFFLRSPNSFWPFESIHSLVTVAEWFSQGSNYTYFLTIAIYKAMSGVEVERRGNFHRFQNVSNSQG
jgi:hypothetical protein